MINICEYYKKRNSDLRQTKHIQNLNIFESSIEEDEFSDKKNIILDLIKNNQYEKQNPESFYNSLKKSKHPLMLSDYSPSELSQMKLFKLKGYNIGFALKKIYGKYAEIVAVHNNEPDVKGIGDDLVKSAINHGGCYLDHYDGVLSKFYGNLGFIEYKRDKFDPQYDTDGNFSKQYGKSDIIYRVYKDCK